MRYQVATFLLLSSSLVAAENLLKNGSFEEFELVKGKRLYAEVKLKDWNTPFETVRLWTNRKFGSATDGSYKLALDTHKRAFDQISQEVETKEGVLYELCLDAIARMNRSSQFEIYVDNERVLKVKPSKSKWNRYCVSFVGNGKPQTVAIKELSNEDDGRGAILDNVTLEQSEEIVEITPASTPQEVTDENLSQTQNLVKNGSFEEFEAVRVRKLYTAAKLKDWETTNELMSVIRNGVFGDAIDGNYKLGLDSNKRQFDAISQTITTQAQQLYKICLWGKKRKSRSSDFKVLIDDEVVIKGYTFGNWRKYCATFRGKGGEQKLTIQERHSQDDGNGAFIDDVSIVPTDVELKPKPPIDITTLPQEYQEKLAQLSTQEYKTKWFDKAKEIWNKAHPDQPYTHEYYTYQFPEGSDFEAGNPPDNPISPKEWMQKAGLGFSRGLGFPHDLENGPYTDDVIKAWQEKGFKNGRFHLSVVSMIDFEVDPTGSTLKKEYLDQLKAVLQRFVDHNMPVTISFNGAELVNAMKDDREETFRRIINWWRQIAETLKDMSYLVAFENFVEYHGFDNVPLEKRGFEVTVDNNETHYEGFRGYRRKAITNVVRNPGYNNLMAEIAKVIRVTNPKRIFLYKPDGIGRNRMTDITPWRWGPEGDYLKINNQKTPYWLISVGGSANLRLSYIKSLRTTDPVEKERLAESTKYYTWWPAVSFYNGTHIPVWVSLFGIKADYNPTIKYLGSDVTTEELAQYIRWYMTHLQNDAFDENGNPVKISAGFQQSWWIWDYSKHQWIEKNDRWGDNWGLIRETLSEFAKKYDDFDR